MIVTLNDYDTLKLDTPEWKARIHRLNCSVRVSFHAIGNPLYHRDANGDRHRVPAEGLTLGNAIITKSLYEKHTNCKGIPVRYHAYLCVMERYDQRPPIDRDTMMQRIRSAFVDMFRQVDDIDDRIEVSMNLVSHPITISNTGPVVICQSRMEEYVLQLISWADLKAIAKETSGKRTMVLH